MKKSVAIITARGGSKRIPKKNIKDFCGKPIIAYSILAALEAGVFDEVMVSTDDHEIAEVSLEYGAKVPFLRSAENSNDYATTADVIVEVLEQYKQEGLSFDYVTCIYPTAPFVTADILKSAMQKLMESDAKSLMTVVPYSFPLQRSLTLVDDRLEFNCPQYKNTRSQDLAPMYHDAGQLYMAREKAFFEEKSFVTSYTMPYILSEMQVQDIDTLVDWELAELKYRLQNKEL